MLFMVFPPSYNGLSQNKVSRTRGWVYPKLDGSSSRYQLLPTYPVNWAFLSLVLGYGNLSCGEEIIIINNNRYVWELTMYQILCMCVCVCIKWVCMCIYIHTHTHIHLITSIALSGWPQLRFLKKTEKLIILKITKLVSSGVILQNQTVWMCRPFSLTRTLY